MGIPLPSGMMIAGDHGNATVAWCWALNGAGSVVASSLTVVIAMAYGFSAVLFAGLIFYIVAFFILTIIMKKGAFEATI